MFESANADALVGALLDSCTEQVLETMFFSPVLAKLDPEEDSGFERVTASLQFRGNPSGAFEVDVTPMAARTLAAAFLGCDENEVTDTDVDSVLAEFSNMACGFALSNLGRVEYFHLEQPEMARYSEFVPAVQGVRRSFEIEGGVLSICLRVEFEENV